MAVVSPPRPSAWFVLCFACLLPLSLSAQSSNGLPTVQRVALLGDEAGMQLEITSSQPLTPQTRVLSNPDRVVIDFPNALPGSELRGIGARHGELKGVRVGLFQSHPPTTRVVLDLTTPGSFQILPSGNTVVVRLGDAGLVDSSVEKAADVESIPVPTSAPTQAMMSNASVTITRHPITSAPSAPDTTTASSPVLQAAPTQNGRRLNVSFQDGLLDIDADQATLSEVLYEVQLRTGAEVAIPAGAEKDRVVIKAGPASPREVMATLLNGSRFNFILVGSPQDENIVKRVMLTPKGAEIARAPVTETPNATNPEQDDFVPPAANDNSQQNSQPAPPQPTPPKRNRNSETVSGPAGGPPNRTADGAELPPETVDQ